MQEKTIHLTESFDRTTLPKYRVIEDSGSGMVLNFEERINELAKQGYRIQFLTSAVHDRLLYHTVIMGLVEYAVMERVNP